MRVTLIAVGRLKAGPERDLIDDYARRFDRTARPLGLGPIHIHEIDERKAREIGPATLAAIPDGALIVALDERGRQQSSLDFAKMLARSRDDGLRDLVFVVGGSDGLEQAVRDHAASLMSLGPMVWPHMLVRVMITEQLYRAASILAGAPYHRA